MASSFFDCFHRQQLDGHSGVSLHEWSHFFVSSGPSDDEPSVFDYININNLLSPTDFRSVESQ